MREEMFKNNIKTASETFYDAITQIDDTLPI